ncbi:MAG: thiamine pyrophosphate-dependent enzyme, partial [Dehalococcoidia bacterium]|nr:thiamine pyrophosphate-dependent enzyme [Dehalococcoidia bacterium]
DEARKMDPLGKFRSYLREEGILDEAKESEIQARVKREVDDATDYAEQAPDPGPEELLTDLYAE